MLLDMGASLAYSIWANFHYLRGVIVKESYNANMH